MLVRYGVKLSPKMADIFDMVERNGVIAQMLWVLFPGKDKRQALYSLKAHVWLINERLAETDYQIKGDRNGKYSLVKTEISEVA